ncbi:MAG: tRNA 5-methoxyuridine(34)/uridine 5-oxyacetic acid(34) synthase CmoB [Desulfurivibrio sp.]|nr:tRNA 5-methoxyuridine(34)/uridine 5-oxyacetic acid(34) synthase CmoB [Desulfurivibrio sp.]
MAINNNPENRNRLDYLELMPQAAGEEIRRLRAEHERRQQLPKKGFLRYRQPWQRLCQLPPAGYQDFSGDTMVIGRPDELSESQRQQLAADLRAFMPWRKGPYAIFGLDIDAEWRSFLKWQRLLPGLPELAGKVVADIGCNNGYYMFKMLPHQPAAVVGFEPVLQHYYCCRALQHLAAEPRLYCEPLGVERFDLYPDSFDVIFLMGIIYHRPEPLSVLKQLWRALKPGGELIVESQVIPGAEPMALCPAATYGKAPGVYFVPTTACLGNWLQKSGFPEIEVISQQPMSSTEQRRTAWMTFESYTDFIDPDNPELTVEGYPAPQRAIVKARRG